MSINVVLDMENVLSCDFVPYNETAAYFKKKGAIVIAKKIHYIFPGVIEFIKLLFSTDCFRVSFFNSRNKNVTERLVKKILKLSLGKNKYEEIKETVSILSKNDLVKRGIEWKELLRLYNLGAGEKQKDLSMVLRVDENIENAILIDNNPSYVCSKGKGQAKNLLLLPYTKGSNFHSLLSKCKRYQDTGYHVFNHCFLNTQVNPSILRKYIKEKEIHISKSHDKFFLNFLDKNSEFKIEPIVDVEIVEKLMQLEKSLNTYEYIENKELTTKIYDFVESLGGKSKKICRSVNRIFYAAELLFTALEKSKEAGISISESLFKLQFKKKEDGTYEPIYNKLKKIDEIYFKGLERLKKFNPQLQLITPLSYYLFTKQCINVVLDIDHLLACHYAKNMETAAFFKNKGAIFEAIKTHYIFPGVIEFIKLLFDTEGFRVSFYSSGEKNRNEIFVKKLLKLSLGKQKYQEIKDTVTILSGNDLVDNGEDWIKLLRIYNIRVGEKQKDLSKVLKENEQLEKTILIDDNIQYICDRDQVPGEAQGQVKNFLFVPYTYEVRFHQLVSKCKRYQATGYKQLNCTLSLSKIQPYQIVEVKKQSSIYIDKSEEQFFLNYLDKNLVFKSEPIIDLKIIEKLILLEKSSNNQERIDIENQELLIKIYELVEAFGGKFQKICRSVNRIFYAAGLLFTALEKSKEEDISISESLFRLQYKKKKDQTYKPIFRELKKIDDLYLKGLEKLKKYNDQLELTHPMSYSRITQLLISEEEKIILDNFMNNEAEK